MSLPWAFFLCCMTQVEWIINYTLFISAGLGILYNEAWKQIFDMMFVSTLGMHGLDSQHLFFPGADKTINRSIS